MYSAYGYHKANENCHAHERKNGHAPYPCAVHKSLLKQSVSKRSLNDLRSKARKQLEKTASALERRNAHGAALLREDARNIENWGREAEEGVADWHELTRFVVACLLFSKSQNHSGDADKTLELLLVYVPVLIVYVAIVSRGGWVGGR